jgi:hypothetical protein
MTRDPPWVANILADGGRVRHKGLFSQVSGGQFVFRWWRTL